MELGLKVTRNSKKFRQPAIHFQKNECYIFAPPGTSEYIKYWTEEANRCLYGFIAEDGDRIPGYFYFYLNYFPIGLIKNVEIKDSRGNMQKKVQHDKDFPSFYDYDRFFFEAVEEAELLGKHLVVLKARRKGYSYKVASMLIRNFYFIRGSKNFALASEAEYLLRDGILSKAWDGMDFLDQNTAWFKKRHKTDTKIHKRASFIVKDHTGVSTEMGYKSEIMGVTLKNDPQKARGKGGKLIIFEEAGKFPKLLDAWQIARPSVEQGSQVHGTMIAFGCVCKGTKVFTNEGIPYNIEDLVKTDGIVGYNNQKAVQQDIKAFREPYKTQCYKIVTNAGKTLECSYDHPIAYSTQKLNRDIPGIRQGNRRFKEKYWKWKKAEDFKTGDQVGVIEEVPFFGKAEIWNPRLIGWLIGDGTYGYDKTPKLSNCDEEINNYIESNFDTVLERGHITKDGKEYKETRLRGICSRLRNLGIYGQTKGNKTLPSVIWKAKKEDVQELLAGLFDTDGYITDPEKRTAINITSAYESLLNEIQLLLVKLGIHGVIERIKVNIKRPIDKNDYFRLTIRDKRSLLNFVDNIRFFPRHKQERLLKYKEVLSNHKERLSQHIQGLRFERVVFIEKIGEKEVYNLTASNTHTYVANGIVTKNTGGTESANYEGLCELFERPEAYGCLVFKNIWDDHLLNTKCGFFIPQYANLEGTDSDGNLFMDEDGNTNVVVSKRYILEQRDIVIKNASDRRAIDRHIAEQPITPAEATLNISTNIFPKADLQNHLSFVRNHESVRDFKQVGELLFDQDGKLKWELNPKLKDLRKYRLDPEEDRTGAIVIWEHPPDNSPYGLYIIGVDPYDHDQAGTDSLGSCIVYKRIQTFEAYYDLPVAEYTGRPEMADMFYEQVRRLALYYKGTIMYENEKKGLFTYFANMNMEYLLADQPDTIKDIVKDSIVQRGKGIHMSTPIKLWGEGLIKDWLIEEYAPGKKNLTKIFSEALLEELISYGPEGNFDRCLVKGTQISMEDGYRNIEDIEIGDRVITHKGDSKKVSALDKHKSNKKILKFKTIGNYETLIVTDNHPIYVACTDKVKHKYRKESLNNIDFKEAKELNYKYQFILQPKRKKREIVYATKYLYDDDLLYLLGWYVSDGYVSGNQISICLQKNQMKIAFKLKSILNRYGEPKGKFSKGRQYLFKGATIVEKDGYIKVRKGSEMLAKFLEESGGKANNKKLSKEVYNSSNLLMLAVGYLEGDGHQKKYANYDGYKRETIEASGIHEILVKQIRQILIDNGIWSSIRFVPKKQKQCKDQYSISISRKYINKIAEHSLKFHIVDDVNLIEKNYQYETEEGFWTPIKLIEEIKYDDYVYNFEVEDDNSYIASNVAVHNCMAFMQIMIYIKELHHITVKKVKEENKKALFEHGIFRELNMNRKQSVKLII